MRLWSIHPKYLDSKGLTALWREALLAKKVLEGKTISYANHPQMRRFRRIKLINAFLHYVYKESCRRGYCFDSRKVSKEFTKEKIKVNSNQIKYEFRHLKKKLKKRDRKRYFSLLKIKKIEANPIFKIIKGPVEDWEKIS